MVKKILTAMFLTTAVAFAPVAAWAQNASAEKATAEEKAPAKVYHHHHHHHHHKM